MRTLLTLLLCVLAAGCAGAGISGLPGNAERFSLTVLPESFALGGSAEGVITLPRTKGSEVVVDIAVQATDLKAFYFELEYDAQQWHPVSVEQTLGSDEAALELSVLDVAGTVHAGRVLVHPAEQAGITGELTLASVRFAPGAAESVRTASAPPDLDSSATTLTIDEAGLLTWDFYNTGDYDQNREVTVADLTPLGVHLGDSASDGEHDPVDRVVDGNNNGLVELADLTPIGANLGNRVAAYHIYVSQNPDDYPTTNLEAPKVTSIGEVLFEDAEGVPTQERLTFSFDASTLGGLDTANLFWVRPVDSNDVAGTPSNAINPPTPGNAAPNITAFVADVNPTQSGGTANLTVTVTDAEGDPLTFSYDTTAGTVDDTGTNTTVFHAPDVTSTTNVTVTVTVDDGQGHQPTRDLIIVVEPIPVTEVHLEFTPAAEGGSGTELDAYGLLGNANYTFTATDQDGNDITSETTFSYVNDEVGSQFPQGAFNANTFTTNVVGSSTFAVIGTYRQGQPEELASNPDAAGEDMHFTIVFTLP